MPYINPGDANRVLEELLDEKAKKVASDFGADLLTIWSGMADGLEGFVRDALETIPKATRRDRLAVVLETDGGSIEVVDRIVQVLRHHYPQSVEFIIPNHAMSAGTVLAMSGDAIWMDYFAVLGPIDPQVQSITSRRWIPAKGYLEEYKKLVQKSADKTLTTAEAAFMLQKFDPAELYAHQHAVDLSVILLKNWTKTKGRGIDVTADMRLERAEHVAKTLGDVELWHSHGRCIHMAALRELVKLEIDDFGADGKEAIKMNLMDYYRLLTDFMRKNGHGGIVHTPGLNIPLE